MLTDNPVIYVNVKYETKYKTCSSKPSCYHASCSKFLPYLTLIIRDSSNFKRTFCFSVKKYYKTYRSKGIIWTICQIRLWVTNNLACSPECTPLDICYVNYGKFQNLKWIMGICVGIKHDGKVEVCLYRMYNMISWKASLHAKCIHELWARLVKQGVKLIVKVWERSYMGMNRPVEFVTSCNRIFSKRVYRIHTTRNINFPHDVKKCWLK